MPDEPNSSPLTPSETTSPDLNTGGPASDLNRGEPASPELQRGESVLPQSDVAGAYNVAPGTSPAQPAAAPDVLSGTAQDIPVIPQASLQDVPPQSNAADSFDESPQSNVDIPQTNVSGERSQPEEMAPSARPKIPLKALLLGVGALVFLGAAVFLVKSFFLAAPLPQEVTIKYWGLWEDSQVLSDLIAQYEKSHPNVKINYQKQSKEDYRERLANSLAKGDGPDIFRYHNTWVPMFSSQLSSLPPDVMDPATYQSTFYPVAVSDLRRGTDIVGIPLMFDGLSMYINDEIFNAAGRTPPVTWDELRRMARELTIRDEGGRITQAGAALGRTENIDHWQDILSLMMLQDGANLNNPTGENAEKPLLFYTVFATEDKVWDETLPASTRAFAGGKVAMYFGPSWRSFEIKQQNPNLKFRIVPVPQLPKDDPSKEEDITWATYWAEGVWSKSKAQRDAWEFLKFLSQKDSLQKMYSQASKTRLFGEVYPRPDMANLLQSDPYTGAFAAGAAYAKSWYLVDRTFDGPTGINTRISAYWADAVNAIVNDNKEPSDVLPIVAQGTSQVLQSYSTTR